LIEGELMSFPKRFAAAIAGLLLFLPWHQYAGAAPDAKPPKTIVFFGDSLTAGFGLDLSEAYPSLIQSNVVARALPFEVVNAGVSGDTTSGGLRRIDWLLRRKIDVLVVALGGNDGLRGISPELTRTNLQGIIDKTLRRNPTVKIVVAGMRMPPNLGEAYTREFSRVFPEVARINHATLIPFLLEGVGGVPELNQPDHIHPTAEGQKRVAETVWKVLLPLLKGSDE
jgi:acyl-CoA thioesterase-1